MTAGASSEGSVLARTRNAILAHNEKVDAEKLRLQALISRHTSRMDSLSRQSGRHLLETVGAHLAQRVNEKHGTALAAHVSGSYGIGPDWYLYLRDERDETWAIVKFVGGVENMTIRREGDRGPGIPFPDDLDDLVEIFEASRVEDEARRTAVAGIV